MAVDKIKPLKLETSAGGGTENDMFPTEADPAEDYAAIKGVAYENSDAYLSEKIGGLIQHKIPSFVVQYAFDGNGEVSTVQYYTGVSAITANRIARMSATYDGSFNLTQENWTIYTMADGTTPVRSVVYSHVYSGVDIITSVVQTG